jgi:hypothetical protein
MILLLLDLTRCHIFIFIFNHFSLSFPSFLFKLGLSFFIGHWLLCELLSNIWFELQFIWILKVWKVLDLNVFHLYIPFINYNPLFQLSDSAIQLNFPFLKGVLLLQFFHRDNFFRLNHGLTWIIPWVSFCLRLVFTYFCGNLCFLICCPFFCLNTFVSLINDHLAALGNSYLLNLVIVGCC